ncbi:hypothetical protein [uncultured Clostridium sp.]|uniref:hypothetical protein n=1 Tax=uncultured Clostridium sp. TaxID=59620 RepID=UPI0028EBD631|nr:hypothetical protein [uncultured Clostridium sp.]
MKIEIKNIKILLVFCLFALIIFNYDTVKSEQISDKYVKPLTSSQIDNYIKEKKLTPITIKTINNYTIILYELNDIIGIHALTSDQYGNVRLESNSTGRNNSNRVPVSIGISGGWDYNIGGFDFVWLIINDKQILNEAHSAKIILSDKTQETVNIDKNKGLIIPISSCKLDLQHIYILDKENNMVYERSFG